MKFLLFDRDENYIGNLKDVTEAKHTEEINGEDVLELTTLDEKIEKGFKIAYKSEYGYWKEFIIREIEESHTSEGIEKRLFCESSFYETWGDFIEDKRPTNTTASVALAIALEPTRWEVGIVDDLGLNSTNFYHISAKEAAQKVATIWKGEIRTRAIVSGSKITHRYVDLLARRGGDYGKRFTYTKDLISITKTVHRDDVITALYGYGKGQEIVDEEGQPTGGYGRRITFGDINGGKNYVENEEARLIWGRNNPDGTKSHVFGKVEFDDVEDPEELLRLTKEKLEELSKPLITYECKVIDLKAYGFEYEGVELGDWVGIVDKEFKPPLRLKARVIKIVRDLLEPENNDLVLGNFIPSIVDSWNKQEQYISNFRGKQGVWDRARIIESDGTINAQFLKNLVDELNTRMNALGGYVYISEDGKGLITYDKPIDQNPTMAIQLLGGSFRIANSKTPDGEWNWRTFGDGNGFVADAFIGGLLKGGKVHFDLTNGTLLIGNNTEDYNLYFDGNNLSIKLSNNKSIETALTELETGLQDYADQAANQAIDNIQIGGRNLIPNTSDKNKTVSWSGWDYYLVNVPHIEDIGLSVGDPLVFRLYIEETNAPVRAFAEFVLNDGNEYRYRQKNGNIIYEGESGWSEVKFTISEEDVRDLQQFKVAIRNMNRSNATVTYRKAKLEKGTKATDWTPAPEDIDQAINTVDTKIDNKVSEINLTLDGITSRVSSTESAISTIDGEVSSLQSRVQSAEQKITPTAIVSTVRQSTAYQNDLDGKVSKNNIISEINQSAEEVQINANRLRIGTGTTFQQGEIYTWQKYVGKTWSQVISNL